MLFILYILYRTNNTRPPASRVRLTASKAGAPRLLPARADFTCVRLLHRRKGMTGAKACGGEHGNGGVVECAGDRPSPSPDLERASGVALHGEAVSAEAFLPDTQATRHPRTRKETGNHQMRRAKSLIPDM